MVGCISKMNRKRIDSSILDTYNLNTKTLKTISIEWLIFSFNDFFYEHICVKQKEMLLPMHLFKSMTNIIQKGNCTEYKRQS